MRLASLLLLISLPFVSLAQADSSKAFTFDQFYKVVINNHPVVKQAALLTEQASQQVRLARGGFDPKLEATWDFKEFKGTEYYNIFDASLKVPLWFPIDPKVGLKQHRGDFLNEQNFIPNSTNNRQLYTGIAVPIGKGLFIDQRRATVRQAKLMYEMAEAEQVKAMNKILLTAAKDYWNWYYAYSNYQVMQQGIDIAQDIFDRTKLAYNYGEAAAIDTVQAKITLLKRITDFQQANIDRIQAALRLSVHLWDATGAPLELQDSIHPEEPLFMDLTNDDLGNLVDMARQNHPELLKINLKGESLFVERNLARENLKPRLDLNYYFLDQPFTPSGEQNSIDLGDNYRMGVDFSFPIFLRKERAKLKQTKLKIENNGFEQDFKEREIINEINGEYALVINTREMLNQQLEMVRSYEAIVTAERLNLENGESDLFKLNLQIEKLLESQAKLLKLKANYRKSIVGLYWAAGVANLGFE